MDLPFDPDPTEAASDCREAELEDDQEEYGPWEETVPLNLELGGGTGPVNVDIAKLDIPDDKTRGVAGTELTADDRETEGAAAILTDESAF